jgi:hypothetical protein
VAVLGLAVAAGVWYWTGWRKLDSALSSLRLRVAELRGRVENTRTAAAEAIEKSHPQDKGRVDDLETLLAHHDEHGWEEPDEEASRGTSWGPG